MESLEDKEIAVEALSLFFHYQSELLFNADEHPEDTSSYPIVVLNDAIRQLFALPIPVSFNLFSLHRLFSNAEYNYKQNSYFHFENGFTLKPTAAYELWYEKKMGRKESIEKEITRTLKMKHQILWGIREKCRDKNGNSSLFTFPYKFFLPSKSLYNNKIISKIVFIHKYERVLEFLKTRSKRLPTREDRIKEGSLFTLTATGDNSNSFLIQKSDNYLSSLDNFKCVFTEDTEINYKLLIGMDDYKYDKNYVKKNTPMVVCSPYDIRPHSKTHDLLILEFDSLKNVSIKKNRRYLLQAKYCDFNSSKILGQLNLLDESDPFNILKLFTDPYKFLAKHNVSSAIKKELDILIKKSSLTPSQNIAFNHFINHNLTLVLGPPGTGKTHFIAISILLLLETSRRNNLSNHILITAFTHIAIENCLNKIIELNDKLKIWKEEGCIFKLEKSKEKFMIVSPPLLIDLLDKKPRLIVGGTVYSIHKADEFCKLGFDTITIDEASQLRPAEALIPMSKIKKNTRLLIVGDDHQLPPIVHGQYKEDPSTNPKIHKSIFEAIRFNEGQIPFTFQLFENFRMNKELCEYPAQSIYGSQYISFDKNIAKYRFKLKTKSKD